MNFEQYFSCAWNNRLWSLPKWPKYVIPSATEIFKQFAKCVASNGMHLIFALFSIKVKFKFHVCISLNSISFITICEKKCFIPKAVGEIMKDKVYLLRRKTWVCLRDVLYNITHTQNLHFPVYIDQGWIVFHFKIFYLISNKLCISVNLNLGLKQYYNFHWHDFFTNVKGLIS